MPYESVPASAATKHSDISVFCHSPTSGRTPLQISYRPVIIEGDNGRCHYLLLLLYIKDSSASQAVTKKAGSVTHKEVTIMENILSEVFGIWFLIGAAFVFFMQAGFAMVETGFTRAKNAGNIIMKNLM